MGGRNTAFAWIVGVVCASVVAVLAVAAIPMFPAAGGWVAGAVEQVRGVLDPGYSPAPAPQEDDEAPTDDGLSECRDLYGRAQWATLRWTTGSELAASVDPPVTTATALVEALQPTVSMTCVWTSDEGRISTTLATVPTDAGAIAAAALPTLGFTCEKQADRMRCQRTDGDALETVEAGGGLWVSSSHDGWRPSGYASGVAESVWASRG